LAAVSEEPVVRVRWHPDRVRELPLRRLGVAELAGSVPWRTFRWHRGQKHFSGFYWCESTKSHVVYESRLELARLLLADFDPDVEWVYAQPFQLLADVGGRRRRHVPDFLLVHRDQTVTVVNVKPAEHVGRPEVAAAVEWTGRAVRERGWALQVWSGADATFLANVRFLAGYRRGALFDLALLEDAAATAPGGTLGDAERALGVRWSRPLVRPALLRLLWCHRLAADLTRPLSTQTVLRGAR
jgi:hypothetical protein